MREYVLRMLNMIEYAGIVELVHFDKHFVKNTRKRGPAGKHFGVFYPRYS